MTGTIDKTTIKDIERVIESDKFAQFLLNNTTDFMAAAFILETLVNAVEEVKNQLGDKND